MYYNWANYKNRSNNFRFIIRILESEIIFWEKCTKFNEMLKIKMIYRIWIFIIIKYQNCGYRVLRDDEMVFRKSRDFLNVNKSKSKSIFLEKFFRSNFKTNYTLYRLIRFNLSKLNNLLKWWFNLVDGYYGRPINCGWIFEL